jgi:catechol 2,3-dioxygenase
MSQNMQDILSAGTGMGAVTLKVGSLDPMIAFYRDGVGLDLLAQDGGSAILGRPGRPSLVLQLAPELKHAGEHEAGLYHTAFLFAEKADLAASVYSVARKYPTNFTGSSDHFVSNAFYFDDPEGNGVELYWDTARQLWEWNGGAVRMGTVYLDPNRFLQENLTETGAALAEKDGPGEGGRHPDRQALLRRHPRLRADLRVRQSGALRECRRLPPPRRDEHLAQFGRWHPHPGPRPRPGLDRGAVGG